MSPKGPGRFGIGCICCWPSSAATRAPPETVVIDTTAGFTLETRLEKPGAGLTGVTVMGAVDAANDDGARAQMPPAPITVPSRRAARVARGARAPEAKKSDMDQVLFLSLVRRGERRCHIK